MLIVTSTQYMHIENISNTFFTFSASATCKLHAYSVKLCFKHLWGYANIRYYV